MEDLLVKVLLVIDRNMNKKMIKLKLLMEKNRINFEEVKREKQELQNRIMDFYCVDDSDASISDQIGFMFRVVENDVKNQSLLDFDINKVIDKTNSSFNVALFEFLRSTPVEFNLRRRV